MLMYSLHTITKKNLIFGKSMELTEGVGRGKSGVGWGRKGQGGGYNFNIERKIGIKNKKNGELKFSF